MINTVFKPKDIEKLIRIAKKHRLKSLKFGTLEIELNTDVNETRATRPALKVSKAKIAEQSKQYEAQEDYNEHVNELSTLHVEDPSRFEQALIDKELADMSGESIEETYN